MGVQGEALSKSKGNHLYQILRSAVTELGSAGATRGVAPVQGQEASRSRKSWYFIFSPKARNSCYPRCMAARQEGLTLTLGESAL